MTDSSLNEPAQSLRQRLKDAATEAMLDAAEKVMVTKGYDKATMQEIAAVAGCATGTLYIHFKNKEELLQAIVARRFQVILHTMLTRAAGSSDPLEKLKHHVEAVLDCFHENRGFFKLFFAAMPGRTEVIRRRLNEQGRRQQDEFERSQEEVIREGQRQGRIRADFTPAQIRAFLDDLGLTMLERFSGDPDGMPKTEQVRLMWGFLSGGVGAAGSGL